jgi:TetR/AcrR family transcriptional regulator, cholesterol catabolism regulator
VPPTNRAVDTPTPLGRRERKRIATRDRILECAVALFASRGYDSTTMDDISECADVARATVFNYFARKDDIVSEWFLRRRTELAKILTEAEQQMTDTASRLRQGFRGLARLYENDPAAGRVMVRAWLRAGGPLLPLTDSPALFANTIRLGQQQGDIRSDVDAARAAVLIFDVYLGELYRWVSDEHGDYAIEDHLIESLDLILTGVAREPSIERNGTRPANTPTDQ